MARAIVTAEIDELPEADRVEGFPHPRQTKKLFGHEGAERALAESLNDGRMHHAWLLSGRQGIGKATLAYRFARAALAAPAERAASATSLKIGEDTSASRQVRALSHPGLLVLRRPYDEKGKRFAASIPIDEVRRLRSFLSHRAGEEAWRVVIVDEANELNVNSANALLKMLEEPPARAVFLLISSAPGRLLPTIRSRCRMLSLQPLSNADLHAAATQAFEASGNAAPDVAALPALERLAEGSVGRLLGLQGVGGLELNQRVVELVTALPRIDWRAVHALSDELQPMAAQARFELFYELLLEYLGRLIRAQAGGQGALQDRDTAARLIGEGRLASFAAVWERIGREKTDALALNLDRKALILETFAGLAAAAQNRKPA
jgi:DNA polymerase III subunit delta'